MSKEFITVVTVLAEGYCWNYFLAKKKFDIYGTYHNKNNVHNSPVKDEITWVGVDLLHEEEVFHHITEIKPDFIVHLAAASSPSESFKNPHETFSINVNSQINLLE